MKKQHQAGEPHGKYLKNGIKGFLVSGSLYSPTYVKIRVRTSQQRARVSRKMPGSPPSQTHGHTWNAAHNEKDPKPGRTGLPQRGHEDKATWTGSRGSDKVRSLTPRTDGHTQKGGTDAEILREKEISGYGPTPGTLLLRTSPGRRACTTSGFGNQHSLPREP